MKNKLLLAVVLILTAILFTINFKFQKITEPIPILEGENPITVRLLNETDNSITEINLEDYIVGVVAAEMPASFELEALKAQAVAARTYAMYKKQTRNLDYDLIIGTKDQAYKDNKTLLNQWNINFFTNFLKIREAVISTKNQVLTYNGDVINAFYFSMSNGYTENCELVFSQDLPYLNSVPSSWDNESLTNYTFETNISKKDFCEKLQIECNTIDIKDINRSASNRVLNLTINNKIFKGTEIRSILGLRSTDFDIEINEDMLSITTRGYGHGVGMSQYGANGMAKEGYNYEEILKHYYQNTEITNLEV